MTKTQTPRSNFVVIFDVPVVPVESGKDKGRLTPVVPRPSAQSFDTEQEAKDFASDKDFTVILPIIRNPD